MSKLWYYADPNSSGHVGPLTLERLQGILEDLPHASDALVWCEDMPEWKRAGEIPTFRPRAVGPPPLPKAFEDEQKPTWQIRRWWIVVPFCSLGVGSRDGRQMMAWASAQRRRSRATKRENPR